MFFGSKGDKQEIKDKVFPLSKYKYHCYGHI